MSESRGYWDRLIYRSVIDHDMEGFRMAMANGIEGHHRFNTGFPAFKTKPLIQHVVENDFVEGLKALLKGPYLDIQPALHHVCRKRKFDLVEVFLEYACQRQRDFTEILYVLLVTGLINSAHGFIDLPEFDSNDQTFRIPGKYVKSENGRSGQSGLHVCALLDKPEVLDHLLRSGAAVDMLDAKGYSAIFCSCLVGSYACTKVLLKHGAKVAVDGTNMPSPTSPLFATCCLSTNSTENDRIVALLFKAGLAFDKETWILSNLNQKYISESNYNFIIENQRCPSRIDMLCCEVVRNELKDEVEGRSILSSVEALRIPESAIENFFLFKFDEK